MKLVDIAEEDVDEVLFVHFPVDTLWDEARDSLELLIADAYDDFYAAFSDDCREEICISPFWVRLALTYKTHNDLKRMTEGQKQACREWCWKEREKKRQRYLEYLKNGVDIPFENMI